MAIQALIPIVPQNQNFSWWNGDRTIIVFSILVCKRFISHLSVYVKLSFLHFNDITLNCDNSLNKRLLRLLTTSSIIFTHNPSKLIRWIKDNNLISIKRAYSFGNLFDCELISNIKRRKHGQTRNIPRFNDGKPKYECDGKTESIGLEIFRPFLAFEILFDRVEKVFALVVIVVVVVVIPVVDCPWVGVVHSSVVIVSSTLSILGHAK
mmetsp:Transcript_24292/g.28619  ORF Transcript_24292/g.28619 Transcript_24292/m.28619 type:complete len:208 (-) Transcript_24292:486-1109(-)